LIHSCQRKAKWIFLSQKHTPAAILINLGSVIPASAAEVRREQRIRAQIKVALEMKIQ
jgi:hypothetical protein